MSQDVTEITKTGRARKLFLRDGIFLPGITSSHNEKLVKFLHKLFSRYFAEDNTARLEQF